MKYYYDNIVFRYKHCIQCNSFSDDQSLFLCCCRICIGFNPVQKLPAYKFLNKENKQCERITHKTHMHRDFPLDPKTETTSLIFHYVPFNVTIHIYTCRSIQYHGPKSIASNNVDRKPSHPIPWTENHCIQKTCAKIMHRTIGGSAQPNIGSKTKTFWGAAPDPIKWGYG